VQVQGNEGNTFERSLLMRDDGYAISLILFVFFWFIIPALYFIFSHLEERRRK
jgi:hypothetical protein